MMVAESLHLPLPSKQLLQHSLIDGLIQEVCTHGRVACRIGLRYQQAQALQMSRDLDLLCKGVPPS